MLAFYEDGLNDPGYLAQLAQVIPRGDQIPMLDWLSTDVLATRRQSDAMLRAYFLEADGRKTDALAVYRQIVLMPQITDQTRDTARSGIRRLGGKT